MGLAYRDKVVGDSFVRFRAPASSITNITSTADKTRCLSLRFINAEIEENNLLIADALSNSIAKYYNPKVSLEQSTAEKQLKFKLEFQTVYFSEVHS
jgi:hypothetical protein